MLAARGRHTYYTGMLTEKMELLLLLYLNSQAGETTLMLAAKGGHTETVKALIKANADISLRNKAS